MQDSAFRFFPLVQHPDFGLTLHPFDLATNKVLALVGRHGARCPCVRARTCLRLKKAGSGGISVPPTSPLLGWVASPPGVVAHWPSVKGARWLAPLVACALGAPSEAWAAPRCGTDGPWVEVEFGRGGWSADFERTVLQDLDAGLEARGLSACEAGAPATRSPTAVVTVEDARGSGLSVTVEVRDAVTEKRVSRDVELARVPSDGRAFAIALAIDELVWATWAELALDSEAKRRREAPPEVVRAVARELPGSSNARLGARFGIEHLPGELTQLGGDGVWLVALTSRVSLELDLVLRQGLPTEAEHGRVSSRSLGVASGLRLEALSGEALALDVGLSARAALFQFQGRPEPGARAAEITAIGVDLRGLLHGRWSISDPLDLELGAGFGWPLRTVHALDQGSEVSSLAGPELLGTLGILVDL